MPYSLVPVRYFLTREGQPYSAVDGEIFCKMQEI